MEENKLSRSFRTLTRLHRAIIATYLETYGLYPGQPRLLFFIDRQPGCTVSQLVDETEQTKEAISVSVKRLEEAGYLRKEVNPLDKREKFLYLSEKGKTTADVIHNEFHRINDAMFEPLNEEERNQLDEMFQKMSDRLHAFRTENPR